MNMTRRDALRLAASAAVLGASASRPSAAAAPKELPDATPANLPRWRGFNLLDKFNVAQNGKFAERDFADIAELGFNFVRLPMDYRCWTDRANPKALKEPVLKDVDQAVELGKKHGVHVQPNFHRAPGFTVASPPEPKSLWTDPEMLEICALHWAAFAKRYKGIPNSHVSFNLVNEPDGKVTAEQYRKVVERLAAAIHEVDPQRLVICDGRNYGNTPPDELIGLNVAAAMHDYQPMGLTHFKATWAGWNEETWPDPVWPLVQTDGKTFGRPQIRRQVVAPWVALRSKGVGVMVGEFGCHNQAQHRYVLSWLNDTLQEFKLANLGWALWNFSGSFGVFDSGRFDVKYESWHGRKLDRNMLDLLQAY